jgi:hypothetical protein
MPEKEWANFIQTLREPLPTTFRLAGSREFVTYRAIMVTFHIELMLG